MQRHDLSASQGGQDGDAAERMFVRCQQPELAAFEGRTEQPSDLVAFTFQHHEIHRPPQPTQKVRAHLPIADVRAQ